MTPLSHADPLSDRGPRHPAEPRDGHPDAAVASEGTHRETLIALALVAAAAALRLFHLAEASLWGDEACMLELAKVPAAEIVRVLASTDRPDVDVAPPVYFLLLRSVTLALGNSVGVARALSALLGIATVAALYGLARRTFDAPTGRRAAALLAFSALHVWYSQEARMYALVTLLAVGATAAFIGWLREAGGPRGRRLLSLYLLLSVAALYTQYYAYLLVAAHVTAGTLLALRAHPERRAAQLRRLALVALLLAAATAPWLPVIGRDLRHAGEPGFPANFSPVTSIPFVIAKFTLFGNEAFVRDHAALYVLFLPLACGLAWRGLRAGVRSQPEATAVIAASLLMPLMLVWAASTAGAPVYKSHPFILVSPLFLLLVALGGRTLRPPLGDVALALLVAANLFVMARLNFGDAYTKPKVQEAMAWVQARMREGDLLLKVPAKLHRKPVETGEILSWKYYTPRGLELRELKANDLSDLTAELQRQTASRPRYFLAIAETRFTVGLGDALLAEATKRFGLVDQASLPSRIRDFGLSVYLFEDPRLLPRTARDDGEPPKGSSTPS